MTNEKWSNKKLENISKKFKTSNEWFKQYPNSYAAASKRGLLTKLTKNMSGNKRWTFKNIKNEAEKFKSIYEWRKKGNKSYVAASKRGLLPKLTKNQKRIIEANNFWTKSKIVKDAKKYKSKKEWRLNSNSYLAARYRGLINEIVRVCNLNEYKRPFEFSKSEIIRSARKYKFKDHWRKNNYPHFQSSIKQNIFDLATKHMNPMGSHYYRCLYSIQIKGAKKIYIGLTYDFESRIKYHLNTKRFKRYKKKDLIIKKITKYLHKNVASKNEIKFIKKYKKKGFVLLNVIKGGGLGGGKTRWTKEKVIKSTKKYKYFKHWSRKEIGAYTAARKGNYVEEATKHLIKLWKKKWTKVNIIKDAKKYKTKSEWHKKSGSAHTTALKKGWYKVATAHMPKRAKKITSR